jgi:hypothetical protein
VSEVIEETLTWERFISRVEDFLGGGWLFRGQSEDWNLKTTLERHVPASFRAVSTSLRQPDSEFTVATPST